MLTQNSTQAGGATSVSVVQSLVKGEPAYGTSIAATTTAEEVAKGKLGLALSSEQAEFSAPFSEWDATRSVRNHARSMCDTDCVCIALLRLRTPNQKQQIFHPNSTASIKTLVYSRCHKLIRNHQKTCGTRYQRTSHFQRRRGLRRFSLGRSDQLQDQRECLPKILLAVNQHHQ